jgi:putative transposase
MLHTLKKYKHNPVHLFLDDTLYFITAAIYEKRSLLAAPALKMMLRDTLQTVFSDYNWQLHHWVILDNHYHLLGQSRQGKDLSRLMHDIHFISAVEIHKNIDSKGRVWWNYWDYCPRNEQDYMTRQSYLLYNPVKHGYVTDLKNYPYSSFHEAFMKLGHDGLMEQFRRYSGYTTLKITEVEDDDF